MRKVAIDITVTTNVDTWVISSSGTSWITLSQTSGTSGTTTVKITASENTRTSERICNCYYKCK